MFLIPLFFLFFLHYLLFPSQALAFCPICTIAIGSGLGLSRWLGIDDAITGIWLGAFTLYLALWLVAWLKKKNIKNGFLSLLVILISYLLTWATLQLLGAYTGQNLIWNLERITVGIIAGSLALPPAISFEKFLRKKNNSKAYFYFQKALIPTFFLLLTSFAIDLII